MSIAETCVLSEEVKSGELLEAVYLDQAINNPDSKEADRDFVLQATYPTAPIRMLLEQVTQKLTGKQPKGGIVIQGDFGSGKSHALLALYHLASSGAEAKEWLKAWKVKGNIPSKTRVGVVQYVSEQPENLWTLLFERVGCSELLHEVREAPTRKQWEHLTESGPVLLILDEVETWFGQLTEGQPQNKTKSALQNLLEAANRDDVPLAVVVSVYGRNPGLMEIVNRTQPASLDVGTAEDRQKIVRHRLVKSVDTAKATKVVAGFVDSYRKASDTLPDVSTHLADLKKELLESFPFHPVFLKQAFQVYAGASHHQNTRGIIYLCATLLRQRQRESDLLLASDLDIRDEAIASDLRKLDPDLVSNAHEDLTERCRQPYATGIIGTVLLHSFSPLGTAGATHEEVLLGNFRPSVNINDLQSAVDEVMREAWFADEVEERLVITKEVVLLKQIEQQARAMVESSETSPQVVERVKEFLREKAAGDVLLYPDEPLPEPLTGGRLAIVLSLDPMKDDEVRALLPTRGNSLTLVLPKPSVRARLTHDREILLDAARIAVCETLLGQRSKRQGDVRTYKGKFERQLGEKLGKAYGRWMRLSRTNDLGEEPQFVLRPVEVTLDVDNIRTAIQRENDVEVVKSGIQKILKFAGRGTAKGSAQAGRMVRQIHDELRGQAGLPLLVDDTQLGNALASMVADKHATAGVVVAVGRAYYGYDDRALPRPLSDDWRVWLKANAPEPPAPQDVKHAVRQALAEGSELGKTARKLKSLVSERLPDAALHDALRALVELTVEGEAVIELGDRRWPGDEGLTADTIADEAEIWLASYAPPDDRLARKRILELVKSSGEDGLTLGQLRAHLTADGVEEGALLRGLKRIVEAQQIVRPDEPAALIHDVSQWGDDVIIALPRQARAQVEVERRGEQWRPFSDRVGPYRYLDQLLRDLNARLPDSVRLRSATFQVEPMEDAPDLLFGRDEELAGLGRMTARHTLQCDFSPSASKAAFVRVAERLTQRLGNAANMRVTVDVNGEVTN